MIKSRPDFTLRHVLGGYHSLSNRYLADLYLNQFVDNYAFDDRGVYFIKTEVNYAERLEGRA